MEYGLSLLQSGRLLHAQEVAYDDTREQQIVCPACREPIIKVGSVITKLQYFRHYKAKETDSCDLRVRQIVRDALNPVIIRPRGQQLDEWLKRFEEIVMEYDNADKIHIGDGIMVSKQDTIDRIKRRPTFRLWVYQLRNFIRDVGLGNSERPGYSAIVSNIGTYSELPEELLDKESDPALVGNAKLIDEVITFLTSPNAFSALLFAASYGMYRASLTIAYARHRGWLHSISPHGRVMDASHSYFELMEATDRGMKKIIRDATKNGSLHKLNTEIALAVCTTAVCFVLKVCHTNPTT